MTRFFTIQLALLLLSLQPVFAADFTKDLSLDSEPKIFLTPSPEGRLPFVKAMEQAQKEIRLYMYRLTDTAMVKELGLTKGRGVRVRVILDQSMSKGAGVQKSMATLKAAGVEVLIGSPRFTMTHAKTMIVDDHRALVTSMNMTWTYKYSRGVGLDVVDKSVATELVQKFDEDWEEAALGLTLPPTVPRAVKVKDANLIWSPDNSEGRLIELVDSAKSQVQVMVENLGATPLLDAFIRAVKQKSVKVMVLVPLCTTSSTPLHNWDYIQKLQAGGVVVRSMPVPYSGDFPYTHTKAMIIDSKIAYVGSMNFSKNSLQKSREVGLIFDNAAPLAELGRVWTEDWSKATPPPGGVGAATCPVELVRKPSE